MYEDKTLVCKECGEEFVFSAGEQDFFAQKGLVNEPKCCKPCRDARKQAKRGARVKFTTVCDECGGVAEVNFKPSEGRSVYCSECFSKRKEAEA